MCGGTFGLVLTESLFEAKLAQYPDALAGNADFIRQTWVGGRTTDCVGLIKGYGWLDTETEEIVYNTNGCRTSPRTKCIMPQASPARSTPFQKRQGWRSGNDRHIGVYIGNGEVVESNGHTIRCCENEAGSERWTHWLKIPYISYD